MLTVSKTTYKIGPNVTPKDGYCRSRDKKNDLHKSVKCFGTTKEFCDPSFTFSCHYPRFRVRNTRLVYYCVQRRRSKSLSRIVLIESNRIASRLDFNFQIPENHVASDLANAHQIIGADRNFGEFALATKICSR